ncbi:MAG: hypothetical protein PVJ57_02810 [Phycisphaerae bacterium]|jgi:hypothetical protein
MNAEAMPNPEFVKFLEWQLESTVRRQKTLNGTPRAAKLVRSRVGTMLALAVVSMFIGGSGTYAATHRSDRVAAELYIARGEAMLEIARTLEQYAGRDLDHVRSLREAGMVMAREVLRAEARYVETQSVVETRELELTETRLTGKEPNDGLAAPRVDGCDFVSERLAVRRPPLEAQLKFAVTVAQRKQVLVESGLAMATELKDAQAHVADIQANLDDLDQRLTLRASFLAGELSAREVELQGMRLSASVAREAATRRLAVVTEQHQRRADLAECGMVHETELRASEATLRTIQAEVELAELELRIIDEKIAETPDE